MDVASLELSKELCELSGWFPPYRLGVAYCYDADGYLHKEYLRGYCRPAYTLGYLIRKLPQNMERRLIGLRNGNWKAKLSYEAKFLESVADTPEDALCKLAIELFRAGILTKDGGRKS